MERIVGYKFDEEHNTAYIEMLNRLYEKYNHSAVFIRNKSKTKHETNHFFQTGDIKNFIAYANGKAVGHISAITDTRLKSEMGEKIGIIGFYECSPDVNLSKELIENALEELKARGCKVVRGPIDLTTWHNYRF